MNFKVLTAVLRPLKIPSFLKALLMIKIAVALIFAFALQSYGNNSAAQTVTLSERNAPLKTVIKKIEDQTGYYFWYEKDQLNNTGTVTVQLNKAPLKIALENCLKEQPIDFEIINKIIWLKPREVQLKEIAGIVKDPLGNPLGAATVEVRGKDVRAITDQNGWFRINAEPGDVIIVSYIGYESKQITIGSDLSNLEIVLIQVPQEIENIVVTALGIKRSEKALTYNVQQVSASEFLRNKDANFVNSLTGKVAGITINSSSSGIGGATRVVVRGAKSINGNNNALFVVDGIPTLNNSDIPNATNDGNAGQISDIYSANTGSDIISLLNPEDIESVSIFTGAAATALYGHLGQNGVISVNTRSVQKGKVQIGLNNSTAFMSPFVMPAFQNTYGPNEEGRFFSWGPKLATPSNYKPRDFFQTGNNITTGLSASIGGDKNQTFISGSVTNANGIIPNNKLERYNGYLKNTASLLKDKITVDFSTMYINQSEQNMVAQGLYHNPIVPVYLFPPGGDYDAIKVFERYDPNRNFPTQYWPWAGTELRTENPYWITNREFNSALTKRLLLGVSVKYNIYEWLNITARGRFDKTDIDLSTKRYASTDMFFAGYGGGFGTGRSNSQMLYGDLIANVNKKINRLTLTGNIGTSRSELSFNRSSMSVRIPQGAVPNIFTTDNTTITAENISLSAGEPGQRSEQSAFANAEIGYKNLVFVNGSYRVDWFSQLYFNEQSKLYVGYPSIGVSTVLTDVLKSKSPVLSYAKLRANYAEVGNPPNIYDNGPQVFLIQGGTVNQNSPLHYPLVPERTKSWEAGANLKFLRNKINLDVTLYSTQTLNQVFKIAQSTSSGGNSTFLLNAGRVDNNGIETALGYNGNIGALKISSNATFTLNNNKIHTLFSYDGVTVDSISMSSAGSYIQWQKVGGNISAIYTVGDRLKQDQDGYIITPLSTDGQHSMYVGNADPKYILGWNNNISYKNLNLGFLVYARVGGVGVSATQAMLDAYGVSKESADARERGYILINGAKYSNVQEYYSLMSSGLNGVLGYYVYDATNVRLRELSLGYTFPEKIAGKVIKSLKVALTGNNLFMFYNKSPFDPESTASTGTYYQGIDYFRQPSLRSVGFRINVLF
ncbi:MAG: SusC/RagA family TonB-linked outer membrane protein [Niabella sp.]